MTLLKKIKLSIQLMEHHDENPFTYQLPKPSDSLERRDKDIIVLDEK